MQGSDSAGRLIRTARTSAGLTQTTLAERADESQSVVSAYERGRRQPSAAAMIRLIEAAGYQLVLIPAPRPIPEAHGAARQFLPAVELAELLPSPRRPPGLDFPRLSSP